MAWKECEAINKKAAAHNVEIKRESINESPTFTAEEYKQIMALLYNKYGNDQPFANATGNNEKAISDLKKFLNSCFKIKDLGPLKCFLGIEVARSKAGITVCQQNYTLDILEETRLLGAKLAIVPMEPDLVLTETGSEALKNPTQYRRLVGKLIYFTIRNHILYEYTQPIHTGTQVTSPQGCPLTLSIPEGSSRARIVILIK
ncbi:cysteine-rich RLK (RECEPTOR-like protein kinase) 8 [Abeliophyllum distichum]|uniref:Cysteine-rich RLK (RECEPTOR-like protein kinase) 8 n=1 Tax=Abeliophyllum distichum TaxID=126358 RepID=A0ABD1TZK7_9LAMI